MVTKRLGIPAHDYNSIEKATVAGMGRDSESHDFLRDFLTKCIIEN